MSPQSSYRSPGCLSVEHPGGGNLSFGDFHMDIGTPNAGDDLTMEVFALPPSLPRIDSYRLIMTASSPFSATYVLQDGDDEYDIAAGIVASFSEAGYSAVDNGDKTFTISNDTPNAGCGMVVLTYVDANATFAAESGLRCTTADAHGYVVRNGAFQALRKATSTETQDQLGTALDTLGNVITGVLVTSVTYDSGTDVLTLVRNADSGAMGEAIAGIDPALVVDGNGYDKTRWLGDNGNARTYIMIENTHATGDARINFGAPAVTTGGAEMGQLIPAAGGVLEMNEPPSGAINISCAAATRFVLTIGNR